MEKIRVVCDKSLRPNLVQRPYLKFLREYLLHLNNNYEIRLNMRQYEPLYFRGYPTNCCPIGLAFHSNIGNTKDHITDLGRALYFDYSEENFCQSYASMAVRVGIKKTTVDWEMFESNSDFMFSPNWNNSFEEVAARINIVLKGSYAQVKVKPNPNIFSSLKYTLDYGARYAGS